MTLAEKYRVDNNLNRISIAFPCISTSVYGYSIDEAWKIAVDTILEINNNNIDVAYVCFDDFSYELYRKEINNKK